MFIWAGRVVDPWSKCVCVYLVCFPLISASLQCFVDPSKSLFVEESSFEPPLFGGFHVDLPGEYLEQPCPRCRCSVVPK